MECDACVPCQTESSRPVLHIHAHAGKPRSSKLAVGEVALNARCAAGRPWTSLIMQQQTYSEWHVRVSTTTSTKDNRPIQVTPKLPKLRSVGQSPGQQNIRFAPIVRSEKKTRNGIVEEWRVEAPLPQDRLIPLETLHQKKNKSKKGKNKGYLKMISKLRKQRRLNNYASVYSMPIKETLSPRSPRQKVADINRTLNLEETKISDIRGNEGKEVVDPTLNLYRKAWLLQQQKANPRKQKRITQSKH